MLLSKFCHIGNYELVSKVPHFIPYKNFMPKNLSQFCNIVLNWSQRPFLQLINLERQNVNLVMHIFNEYTIQGLLIWGKQKCLLDFAEVAEYINIFYICWTIMNVKTSYKGCQLRNKYCNPLRVNEENFRLISVFCNWVEFWNSIPGRNWQINKWNLHCFASYNLYISKTDQVLHRRIENAIHITWQFLNWSTWGKV